MRVAVLLFGEATLYSEVSFSQLYQQTDSIYADTIEYSPISRICVVGSESYRPTALIGIPTLFDLLLLVLTACKAMRTPSLKSKSIVRVKFRLSLCEILRWNLVAIHFGPGRAPVRGIASAMRRILPNRATGIFPSS